MGDYRKEGRKKTDLTGRRKRLRVKHADVEKSVSKKCCSERLITRLTR